MFGFLPRYMKQFLVCWLSVFDVEWWPVLLVGQLLTVRCGFLCVNDLESGSERERGECRNFLKHT